MTAVTTARRVAYGLVLAGAALLTLAGPARADFSPFSESEVDPSIFRVDEARFLGARPDPALAFRDESGQRFTLDEMTGKPLILVLSYYTCDGTCSLVNKELATLLKGVGRVQPGRDYRVLTVSFDPHDTAESLARFRTRFEVPAPVQSAWRFGLPAGGDDARRLADAVGFKYFWSPRDGVFLHPGVFVFLSGEGRVVRYLYAETARPLDVELALIDAKQNKIEPGEVLDLALSVCYSYNYRDGRYSVNYPLFVGLGSLIFGFGSLTVAFFAYKRRARKGELII